MLNDVKWPEDGTYTPQGEHTPIEFFSEALSNSVMFDIQLGYFNSAAVSVLSYGFATFIRYGGRMRMAINQIVSHDDKVAIRKGEEGGLDAPFDLMDWKSIKTCLDEYGEHFFKCLSYLIQEKRIDIRIIKPNGITGISHTKKGQFRDLDGTVIGFNGSANFTLGGFINNLEDLTIYKGDSPDPSVRRKAENQRMEFDRLMSGLDTAVEYLSSKDLEVAIRTEYPSPDIEELLDVERKLRAYRRTPKGMKQKSKGMIEMKEETPTFPYHSNPRPYQQEAFENWKKNHQKGLFAMATGTGKTITSLNCLLEIYKHNGYYKAIILVPTITLVNQWAGECAKFNFTNIIMVSSKNPDWHERIDTMMFAEKISGAKGNTQNFIIISTYASFAKPAIFSVLNSFDKTKVLLIADEAHNMGSPSILRKLKSIIYLRRIGLSATPERQFDMETNERLFQFFGASLDHYTYEYGMRAAIDNGFLCKYYYYPHLVRLTPIEMEKYVEYSLKISKYYNYNTGRFDHEDDYLKMLLLARKRIIHKAENKLEEFRSIIEERYSHRGDLKYTLVYVPEGTKPDYISQSDVFDSSEEVPDDTEADRLINDYTAAVQALDPHVTVRKFTSGQKDREEILDDFASGKLQVLTSMKCLDEGVDVPRSELAIFCSSTGNPRQFIQRRGRVLRTHKDKKYAIIHDLVVLPEVSENCDSYRMERALLKGELARVRNFAELAENHSESVLALKHVMDHYGLNLYNNDYIL